MPGSHNEVRAFCFWGSNLHSLTASFFNGCFWGFFEAVGYQSRTCWMCWSASRSGRYRRERLPRLFSGLIPLCADEE